MNRKLVGGLLIVFFILFIAVIINLFVKLPGDYIIYSLFIIELFYLTWVATRKISISSPFRKLIGTSIILFFPLLILTVLSLILDLSFIEKIIYLVFGIDFLFLFVLFIRKSIRNVKSKRAGKEVEKEKLLERIVKYVVVYGIPLAIIGYVVYMNWLPFGFEKTYVLDVGAKGDTTTTNELYLERNDALSESIQEGEQTFRTLEGSTNLMFKPKVVLKNAKVEVEVVGDNVFVVPPKIDFDPLKYEWNLSIDFSKGIPDFLEGNVELINNCAYFDGQSSLSYPNTYDQFEKGPFTIYAEWTPENDKDNFQQIMGHFNWELLQNSNSVKFQIGRMNDNTGPTYAISNSIDLDFLNNKHSVLAIYKPLENGYIDLFIDDSFAGREYIKNDAIWQDYNKDKSLSFGKSDHGVATHYVGCIHKTMFSYYNIDPFVKKTSFYTGDETLEIPIVGYGKIDSIEIKIKR